MDNNENNIDDNYNQQDDADNVSTYKSKPSVGGGSTKAIFIAAGLILFAVYMIYSIFYTAPPPSPMDLTAGDRGKPQSVAEGGDGTNPQASLPLPPPPKATLPPPPAMPSLDSLAPLPDMFPADNVKETSLTPPPPPLPPSPELSTNNSGARGDNEKLKARIRSNMLVMDGAATAAPTGSTASATANRNLNNGDANRAFASDAINASGAEKAIATRLNNLNITIAQGKIINAVLETAINTDLPGTIRAIVARDTYAESGRNVLIPKGSRLLGTYSTGILRGQGRVMIVWTRVIRPDGIDIAIGSPAVDGLGRAGIKGFVDNKYTEVFSAAILTTVLSLGAAEAAYKIMPKQGTTTTGGGSTTTTVNPAQQAAAEAVTNFSDISKSVVEKLVDLRPTITIDQGTIVNVFVNRDLTFPSDLDNMVFVQ